MFSFLSFTLTDKNTVRWSWGIESWDIFFSFLRNIFYFYRDVFLFLGKYFLFLGKCFLILRKGFFPREMFFFNFSGNFFSSREILGICGFGNLNRMWTCTCAHEALTTWITCWSSAREDKKIMEKKQDDSMESKCSFSSSIKYELSHAKGESMKRELGMAGLLVRISGKNMIAIRKKEWEQSQKVTN